MEVIYLHTTSITVPIMGYLSALVSKRTIDLDGRIQTMAIRIELELSIIVVDASRMLIEPQIVGPTSPHPVDIARLWNVRGSGTEGLVAVAVFGRFHLIHTLSVRPPTFTWLRNRRCLGQGRWCRWNVWCRGRQRSELAEKDASHYSG